MSNNCIVVTKIAVAAWKTSLLLHFDEAVNATSVTSEEGKVCVAGGTVGGKVSSNAFNDGNSFVIPGGSCLAGPSHNDFVMGTGDFTLECWIGSAAAPSTGERSVISLASGGQAGGIVLGFDTNTNRLVISEGNGTRILTSTGTFGWSKAHMAYSRKNGIGYLSFNGSVIGSAADSRNYLGDTLTVGQVSPGYTTRQYTGYIDEIRLTKGLGRYDNNAFTPATRLSLN